MEEGAKSLGPSDCADGINGGAVVVAGIEVGVVEAALELQPGFQDFGGDIGRCGGEIGDEAYSRISCTSRTFWTRERAPAAK